MVAILTKLSRPCQLAKVECIRLQMQWSRGIREEKQDSGDQSGDGEPVPCAQSSFPHLPSEGNRRRRSDHTDLGGQNPG